MSRQPYALLTPTKEQLKLVERLWYDNVAKRVIAEEVEAMADRTTPCNSVCGWITLKSAKRWANCATCQSGVKVQVQKIQGGTVKKRGCCLAFLIGKNGPKLSARGGACLKSIVERMAMFNKL